MGAPMRTSRSMYSKMQSAIQISLGIMIGVGSVVSIGGFDYRMMKQRQAVEDKYWETVESRLAAARLKDEEYARRGLVDPGGNLVVVLTTDEPRGSSFGGLHQLSRVSL